MQCNPDVGLDGKWLLPRTCATPLRRVCYASFLASQSEECAPLSVATGTQPVIVLW